MELTMSYLKIQNVRLITPSDPAYMLNLHTHNLSITMRGVTTINGIRYPTDLVQQYLFEGKLPKDSLIRMPLVNHLFVAPNGKLTNLATKEEYRSFIVLNDYVFKIQDVQKALLRQQTHPKHDRRFEEARLNQHVANHAALRSEVTKS